MSVLYSLDEVNVGTAQFLFEPICQPSALVRSEMAAVVVLYPAAFHTDDIAAHGQVALLKIVADTRRTARFRNIFDGIVGIIGPNGAGKTTLFRLIMGLENVDAGTFEIGETVKLAYVDQQHKDIDPKKSVYDTISQGNETIRMGGRDINARAYISRFNFAGTDQSKLCGTLSGGERNRLQLAMALKQEGNVLLLDEPTNDIDVNTLRALEEGLENFAGCAVVISHDRWFLDRICTHILAFEGNGEVFFFEGSYSEYEINKARRLGNEEIKKGRYRKLMED